MVSKMGLAKTQRTLRRGVVTVLPLAILASLREAQFFDF